ncbi:MAG: IS3 family transposase, partial [Turicibacter sp.]
MCISRSGYYRYFSSCAKAARLKRQQDEEIRLEAIKQAINFKNRTTKGVRQVAMVLQGEFNVTYNLKSVYRIMRKYHLLSRIRHANPYRKIAKATHEHRIYSNKETLSIFGKPTIQYIIEEAIASGIEEILIVTS